MDLLFIDDDPSCNYFHEIIVEESGVACSFTFFNDPTQGLQYVIDCHEKEAERTPTHIFLDLNMPKLDGWEFLQRMEERRIDTYNLFILTTSGNPKDKKRALEHPLVVDFLCKPLSLDFLFQLSDRTS